MPIRIFLEREMQVNHGLKLHPDGTLELTMPKDKKVTRVLVCEAGTQNAKLFYPESYYRAMLREINERFDKPSGCD